MIAALFNTPSFLSGMILGAVFGALFIENGAHQKNLKAQVENANQMVVDCEAKLPRNVRCALYAKEVK